MLVIKCDKCKKETKNSEVTKTSDLNVYCSIDLCKDCLPQYEEMRKEYREYERSLNEVFHDLLKNKADKLNEKYFGKKEEEIKE